MNERKEKFKKCLEEQHTMANAKILEVSASCISNGEEVHWICALHKYAAQMQSQGFRV